MVRTFPTLLKGLLGTLALSVVAPAPVRAAVTLTLRGVPSLAQGGATLAFRLEAGGACAGQRARVTAWLGDTQVFTANLALAGPGEVELVLPTRVLTTPETLVIQASCGEATAMPQTIRLVPAFPIPGGLEEAKVAPLAPEPTVQAAVREGSRSWAESPSPTGPAAQSSLQELPDDVLIEMAEYAGPDHFRGLNKDLNRVAQEATRFVVIQGALTDAELARRLQAHARIEGIMFGSAPNLTPEGIVEALAVCTRLRALALMESRLAFPHLQEILAQHERIVSLWFLQGTLSDAQVAALPQRMTHLKIRSLDVGDTTLVRFQHLKSLVLLQSASFTGEHLPASVQTLAVRNCSAFTGRGLPASLLTLDVVGCSACTGPVTAPCLRTLYLCTCPALTTAALLAAIRQAPQLAVATFEHATREILQALPTGMASLAFAHGTGLGARAFTRFTSLRTLTLMQADDFTGTDLPPSLRNLTVGRCPRFQIDGLGGIPLERLTVAECRSFSHNGLPASLVRLEVANCPWVTFPGLMANLPRLNNLRWLSCLGNGGPAQTLDLQAFENHPTLEGLDYAQVFTPAPGQLWNVSGRPAGEVWYRGLPPTPPLRP